MSKKPVGVQQPSPALSEQVVPKEPEEQKFPVWMTHPGYSPGQLGPQVQSAGFNYRAGGRGVRFPHVCVMKSADLEYYKAQGYNVYGPRPPRN